MDITSLEAKQDIDYEESLTLEFEAVCFSRTLETAYRLQDVTNQKTTMRIFSAMTTSVKIQINKSKINGPYARDDDVCRGRGTAPLILKLGTRRG
jgi:hypothetical protein